MWSSNLLTRTIWHLLISSCFQEQKRRYDSIVSRMSLYHTNNRWQSNRHYQNVSPSGTSSSGTDAAPIAYTRNGSTFKATTLYSRTLVACWTTRCVNGLLSFLPVSLQTWQLQNCARTRYLEIPYGIVFTKFMVLFQGINQRLSVMLWAFFSPRNFKLIFWEF